MKLFKIIYNGVTWALIAGLTAINLTNYKDWQVIALLSAVVILAALIAIKVKR
jgi:hypothetical protein